MKKERERGQLNQLLPKITAKDSCKSIVYLFLMQLIKLSKNKKIEQTLNKSTFQ